MSEPSEKICDHTKPLGPLPADLAGFDADDYRTAGNALILIFGRGGPKVYRAILTALAIAVFATSGQISKTEENET